MEYSELLNNKETINKIANDLATLISEQNKKTNVEKELTNAMLSYIMPYLDENLEFNPKKAKYKDISPRWSSEEAKDVYFLFETTMCGEPYFAILSEGKILRVPQKYSKIEFV